jgi:hypothetical protein
MPESSAPDCDSHAGGLVTVNEAGEFVAVIA